MRLSHKDKSHNRVDYFPLSNGYADVFLHANEVEEIDNDGISNMWLKKCIFKLKQSVNKEQIEANFDFMWNDVENITVEPSAEELQLEYMIDLDYRLSLIEMGLV